jgi:hypothetical protein
MSEQFLKYPQELSLLLQNGGASFEFEDRKSVQKILLEISQSCQKTQMNFQRAVLTEANAIVTGLLQKYGQH